MRAGSLSLRSTRGRSNFAPRLCRATGSLSSSQFPPHVGSGKYQDGDRVIAITKEGKRIMRRILPPLKVNGSTRTGRYSCEIKHDDIIGQPEGRLYVDARNPQNEKQKATFRVMLPTIEDIVSLAPRSVTPIYASYSATIVNLLDVHVSPPQPSNDPRTSGKPPLEILEAGTGHGSLTMHLSQAIAAANPPPPTIESVSENEDIDKAWQKWKQEQRAIVHTIEYSKSRSIEASSLIRSFRGGVYWPHIHFHTGDVGEWVTQAQRSRQTDGSLIEEKSSEPPRFLDIVCLDLPDVHKQIKHVFSAMKEDAQLLVYVPQITQLAACQQEIDRLNLPLKLDRVIELGEGISNGRTWDLRFTKLRAKENRERLAAAESRSSEGDSPAEGSESESEIASLVEDEKKVTQNNHDFPIMICRPMVGKFIMGGAFVGLWRSRPALVKDEGARDGADSETDVENDTEEQR